MAKIARISKTSFERQGRPDLSKQMSEVKKLRKEIQQAEALDSADGRGGIDRLAVISRLHEDDELMHR